MGSLAATLAVSMDFVLAVTFALNLANTASIVVAALALAFTFAFAIAAKTFLLVSFEIVAALGESTLLGCFHNRFAVAVAVAVAGDRIGASEPIPIANVGSIEHGSAADEGLVAGRFLLHSVGIEMAFEG